MDGKYSFGLIGCGKIGNRHAEHIHKYGVLEAVCDTDPLSADMLAEKYGSKAYYSIEDLLRNERHIDIVSICTPNGLHATHTIQSLQAGKHVLCEKPLAITTADGRKMIEAATRYKKHLFVVKQNRFNPPVQIVRQVLNEHKLGKLYAAQLNCFWHRGNDYYKDNWHGTNGLDGGIIYTQFSHFIDLLYWFLGDLIDVKCMSSNFAHADTIEFDDTLVAIGNFASGALATMHFTINAYKQNMEGSLTLFGEKGTIKIGGKYLNTLEYQCMDGCAIDTAQLPAPGIPNDYGTYRGSMSNHHLVYQNIINVLKGKEKPVVEVSDGLKSVAIIEQIYSAAQKI